MASYMELRGTTFNTFTIGKRGPRLNQQATTGLIIEALDSTTATTGGNIGLTAGANTGAGEGGNISLDAGDAINDDGGAITLQSGDGNISAGAINIRGGNAVNNGGNVVITGGDATDPTSSSGGEFIISSGSGVDGGSFTMSSGFGTTGNGGDMNFVTGISTGGGNGGAMRFLALGPTGATNGGEIAFNTGDANDTNGVAADISLTAGNGIGGAGGTGGNINITAGDTTGANGGNINLKPGDGRNAINLLPAGTAAADTAELNFRELVANGTNSVGFKAPDAIVTTTIWTLPDADGTDGEVLTTDGSGTLSWQGPVVYEVSASGSITLTGTPQNVPMDTERFANANFTIVAGVVTLIQPGLYEINYNITSDNSSGTRAISMSNLFVGGTEYPRSRTFGYHRSTASGESTASMTVLLQATANTQIEIRCEEFQGGGLFTVADACNLMIKRLGA